MFRNRHLTITLAIATLITLSFLGLACGGSSHSNQNLSAAQAQAISQELFQALGSALTAGLTPPGSAADASLPHAVQHAAALPSSDCTTTSTGESCNIPITYQGNCPNGGTIAVAGDFIFTLDNNGNGTDSSTLTVTPTNCAVSNVTFNGDPNVTVATQFSMQNNALAYPDTFTESGGISYGPNPSGSCTMNVKLTVSSATTCSVSGTVCGQSVNGSC